jgi:hypothetical protein
MASSRIVAATVTAALCVAVIGITPLQRTGHAASTVTLPGGRGTASSAAPKVRTVLPAGNGYISGPLVAHRGDQLRMYDDFDDVVADGALTPVKVAEHFKDASLGIQPEAVRRVEAPRAGVTVSWDTWGVPHVQGASETDVAFGAGWAVAQARLLVAELLRTLGRSGAAELLGGDLDAIIADIGSLPQVSYTEDELAKQFDDLAATGAEGSATVAAMDAYIEGLNAWIRKNIRVPSWMQRLGITPVKPWTRGDIVASVMAVDAIFGQGGGGELRNAIALRTMREVFGETRAEEIFTDMRMAIDPGATTHTALSYPYPLYDVPTAVDPAAVAIPDPGVVTVGSEFDRAQPNGLSNALVVGASLSETGKPFMIGGPQSAYVFPELLLEIELSGGGYQAGGITIPGVGPYVLMGHTSEYAWTGTAGNSDNVDIVAERLCEPGAGEPSIASLHYEFQGECVPMNRSRNHPLTVWRTGHGPIIGRGTVAGHPVGFALQRASLGIELFSGLSFRRLNLGLVGSSNFAQSLHDMALSLNWFYVDEEDIAYFHSGRYPIRAGGTHPDLPRWGTGEWEWRGFLNWTNQPQELNPGSGYFVSWNNRPAPDWANADDIWAAGFPHRVDLIKEKVTGVLGSPADLSDGKLSVLEGLAIVQDAATADLRSVYVVSEILAVLDGSNAPSAQLEVVRQVLQDWIGRGSNLRDRDSNRRYDHPAAAIVSRLIQPLVQAIFGSEVTRILPIVGLDYDDPPSSDGSAFFYGMYAPLVREMRRARGAIGPSEEAATAPPFCGGGSLGGCRVKLWEAIDAAQWAAARTQPWHTRRNPWAWRHDSSSERIRFLPYVFLPQTMRWSNRPTWQQIVVFGEAPWE